MLHEKSPEENLSDLGATEERSRSNDVAYRCFADIEAQPINWLWLGRIARGKITMIAGHPGLGKSQLTAYLAARVSTGGRYRRLLTSFRRRCLFR